MSLDQLKKWTLVAELAGAVAVVITLGFLVVEMRGNTNALQAQSYQVLMQELNDYRTLVVQQLADPEYQRVQEKFAERGWEGLSRDERQLLRMSDVILWGIYESAYFANERGVLGELEWVRFEVATCRAVDTRTAFWDPEGVAPMTELLTPNFVAYIDGLCG